MGRSCVVVVAVVSAVSVPVHYWAGEPKTLTVGKTGLTIDGKLALTDSKIKVTDPKSKRSADVPAMVYPVRLSGGMKYRLELTGKDFDVVLAIHDGAGKQIAFDDDSGGETNARLEFTPAKDDVYKVVAGALGPTGAFKLTITLVGKAGGPLVAGEALAVPKEGLTITGKVALSDPKVTITLGGQVQEIPAKTHRVKLSGGKKYQFEVARPMGSGLEVPLVILQDKDGKQLDWTPPAVALRVQMLAPPGGDVWQVAVGAGKGEGAFQLTVKEIPLLKEETVVNEVGADGLKIKGKLTADVRVICHQVKLEGGKTYQIDMAAQNQKTLDSYLKVYDAAGKLLAENDDIVETENLDSRLVFRAPSSGVFRVDTSSFANMGAGEFTLEVKLKK